MSINPIVGATITAVKPFGAFILLSNGSTALCPNDELPTTAIHRGTRIFCQLKNFDNRNKPIYTTRGIDQATGTLEYVGETSKRRINTNAGNFGSKVDDDQWEISQMNSAYGGVKRQRKQPAQSVLFKKSSANGSLEDLEEEVEITLNTQIPKFLSNKASMLHSTTTVPTATATNKSKNIPPKQVRRTFEDQSKSSLSQLAERGSNLLMKVREEKHKKTQSSDKSNDELVVAQWQKAIKLEPLGYTSKSSIQEQRESLPIYQSRKLLLDQIRQNDFIVIVGETGSGKSTQITQYLAEDGYIRDGIIACTQPRRVAAISVAKRVSEEVGCKLGNEVGYTIRFDDKTSSKTRIKYMTDGMLQREALIDPDMSKYSVIMLDEAHERTIATDVLFALLKKATIRRKGSLKVIVTSATLDSKKFSEYFNECPIFHIKGRTFPVKIYHSKVPEMDYIQSAIDTVIDIHLNQSTGDILAFLTGREEIETCCETIIQRMNKIYKSKPDTSELLVLPIFSSMPSEMQSKIFEATPKGKRKVVIATNIAETSITIDGIFYVIDPGFVKVNSYDPQRGMDRLIVQPISQAQALQRSGRAGRTGPGVCYRLYTKSAYLNEMDPGTKPEILRQNLSNTLLMLKAMGIDDVVNFEFMDKPNEQSIIKALEELYILDALNDEGKLTSVGQMMSLFPMEPLLSKTLIQSFQFGCSEEVIKIIAMLSVPEIFYRPKEKRELADRIKRGFDHPQGDHLTLLNVYQQWIKNNHSHSWCEENFVQEKSLLKAKEVIKQLNKLCLQLKLEPKSCQNQLDRVLKAFVSGFFKNSAKRSSQGRSLQTLTDNIQVEIHPSSSLFGKNVDYVIYHTLMMTTKEYMQCSSRIDPKWLIQYAPKFFSKAKEGTLSIDKQREKISPLFSRNDPNELWRMSKGRR